MSDPAIPACVAGIVIFHGVEEIDFAAPYAVFSALRRLQIESNASDLPETHVLTISRTPGIIHGANGLRWLPDFDLSMCPDLSVLVVPGCGEIGEPTVPEMEEGGLWDFVHEQGTRARCLAGVGTGAFVLAKAGALAGKRATTRARFRADLARFSGVTVADGPLVEDGAVWTAASGAWGVSLGLAVIARLYGRAAANRTATELDAAWDESLIAP